MCWSVLHYVLEYVAMCCSAWRHCCLGAVFRSMLQCMLQCVAEYCITQRHCWLEAVCWSVLQYVLECVVVCCSGWWCCSVCWSALQCVATRGATSGSISQKSVLSSAIRKERQTE